MYKYTDGTNIVEAVQILTLDSESTENYAFNLWMDVVKEIKKQYANYDYDQSKFASFTANNYTVKSRLDCSGYVYACLSCFFNKTLSGNSTSLSTVSLEGFNKIKFTSFDDLREGDIMVAPGQHTEIFAFNDGQNYKVYSVGTNGIKNPTYGNINAKYKWTTVQRPIFDNSNESDIPKWVSDGLKNNTITISDDKVIVNHNNKSISGNIDDYITKKDSDDIEIIPVDVFESTYREV